MWFAEHHFDTLSASSAKICSICGAFLVEEVTDESSAYMWVSLLLRAKGRSFINNINNKYPMMNSCGTAVLIVNFRLILQMIYVWGLCIVIYDMNHLMVWSEHLKGFNLYKRISWSIRSKALWRSSSRTSTILSSMALVHVFKMFSNVFSQEKRFRKPDCAKCKRLKWF